MSTRSKARKQALDLLFQFDLRQDLGKLAQAGAQLPEETRDYTKEIIKGVSENLTKIDQLIRTYIQGWDFDRLPNVDRNILRLSIWELLWSELPEAVVIDEALKLAAELSTENSPNFIHGVLSQLAALKGQVSF